jgi:hypothetical protein
MKKSLLLSPTFGVLACLTQSAFAQAPAATAPAKATSTATAAPTSSTTTAPAATTTAAPAATPPAETTATTTAPAAPPPDPAPTGEVTTTATPSEEAAPPPVLDTPAPVVATAAPVEPAPVSVPALPYMKRFLPEGNMWELGLFGGLMFPSADHQLFDPALGTGSQRPFNTAGELGVRIGYFPFPFVGVEAEAAAMPTSVDVGTDPVGDSGGLWAVRGHLIGQYPGWSVTPFVLVGFGALGASSDAMGNDVDDAWHFGGGVKVPVD